jgi:hypothetical protein
MWSSPGAISLNRSQKRLVVLLSIVAVVVITVATEIILVLGKY